MDTNKYAANGWKKKKKSTFEIQLDDQLVLVRRLGIPEIVQAGLVAELDTFTPQLLPDGRLNPDEKPENVILGALRDKEKFQKLERTINRVVLMCVIAPRIHPAPEHGVERDEELIYVDEIDFNDRMEIFNKCFVGMGNMSQFPGGQTGDMEPVAQVSGAEVGSEQHGGIPSGVS